MNIGFSTTYPADATSSVLFDSNPRTAISFATNSNGMIDIVLPTPHIFTQVEVYASAGPASPKTIKMYAIQDEEAILLTTWTKENVLGWSVSPAFSKEATHFRLVFVDNYDNTFNYIRVSGLRIHGFPRLVDGIVSIVHNDDCSQVVTSSTMSLCEPTVTLIPGHGLGYSVCFDFGENEPRLIANSHFDLYAATGIRFTTGDESSIVVSTTKNLQLLGSIPSETQVHFVNATNEDTLNTILMKCNNEITEVMDVVNSIVSDITFTEGIQQVYVCYSFPETTLSRRLEENTWSVIPTPFMVKSIDTIEPSFLVAGVQSTITVTGMGLENTSVALTDSECSSIEESAYVTLVNGQAAVTPASTASGEISACFKFPNETPVALKTVAIASIDSQTVTNIISIPHRIFFTGTYLAEGDIVGIMIDGNCELTRGGILETDHSTKIKIDTLGNYQLCYKFTGFASAIPINVFITVVNESLEYQPGFIVSGASNKLQVLIPAYNLGEDKILLDNVEGVMTEEDGKLYISFATRSFDESMETVSIIYQHAFATSTIIKTLPIYSIELDKQGTYVNTETTLILNGRGIENVLSIGFATTECTNEIEMFTIDYSNVTISLPMQGRDYHICV